MFTADDEGELFPHADVAVCKREILRRAELAVVGRRRLNPGSPQCLVSAP